MSGPPLLQCRHDTTLDSENACSGERRTLYSPDMVTTKLPSAFYVCLMRMRTNSFIPCVRAEGGKEGGPTLRKHEDKLSLVKTLPQRKQATAGCLGRVLC